MRLSIGRFVALAPLAVSLVCLARSAHARTITVRNNANAGSDSLRAALASAMDGDRIEFDPSLAGALINLVTPDPRTLVGGSPLVPFGPTALVVDGISVTIDGSNAPGLQIDGAGTWRVFVVLNGGHLELTNITVQNGRALGTNGGVGGGGGSGGFGGAVFVADRSRLTLDGVTMLQNRAQGGMGGRASVPGTSGGGGLITAGEDWLNDSIGAAGGAPNGGARSTTAGASGGEGGGGGGAATYFDVSRSLQFLTGGGNGGWGGGGGGGSSFNNSTAYAMFTVARWDPGGQGGFGGGGGGTGKGPTAFTVFPAPPPATSIWGGGRGGDRTTFSAGGGGGGAGLGGAIFVRGGSLDIARSTFRSNQSISGSVMDARATAGVAAGAIFLLDSTGSVRNSTFSNNSNGAIYVLSLASTSSSSITMQNTVIAGNDLGCGVSGVAASFSSAGNNVIERNGGPMASPCPLASSDRVGIDSSLGSLSANGGPTATMLPSPSSPLVGRGNCAVGDVDQRGRPRMAGPGCDIGAVELDRAVVSVALAGSGTGRVTSDVSGIDCGTTCSTSRTPTPVVLTLTAVPAAGSVFTGFTGGGCSSASTCRVTTSADTTITATFALDSDAGGVDGSASDASPDGSDSASEDVGGDVTPADAMGELDTSVMTDSASDVDTVTASDVRTESDGAMDAMEPLDAGGLVDGDGGSNRLDARSNDGATTRDDSPDAGTPATNAGCGCRTTRTTPAPLSVTVLVAVALATRRRRRGQPRSV